MSENVKSGKCVDCKYCETYKEYYAEWDEFGRQEVKIVGICGCKASSYYNKNLDELDIAGCSRFEAGEGPVYVEGE